MTGFMFSAETMGWVVVAFATGFGWMAADKAAARVKEKVTA